MCVAGGGGVDERRKFRILFIFTTTADSEYCNPCAVPVGDLGAPGVQDAAEAISASSGCRSAFGSPDAKEGLRAFAERRDPNYGA